ncbi:MAG: HAD family phosphatase [Bryobacteraceae bacterium]
MKFDSILFDFDGVLADTEPIHYQCWLEILAPFGIEPTWEYYQRECIGISDRLMVERISTPALFDHIWPKYDTKQALFRHKLTLQSPFSSTTTDLIAELAPHYKLAVVSSSARTEVEPPLIRAGIREYFQALVCGKEAVNLKPAPDPYLLAAKLLNSSTPLVVEDSAAGEASGRAAGFEVLRITSAESMPSELLLRLGRV